VVPQLMFAQHAANLAPVWGAIRATGHSAFTFFNRGAAPFAFDRSTGATGRWMAHLFLFGPNRLSGKSADRLNHTINQLVSGSTGPRLFIVEAGKQLSGTV